MTRGKKNMNQNKLITAKEIMNKYDISYQTINHYTDFGLLQIVLTKGNQRLYGRKLVEERLKQIKKLTEECYSLRLIRKRLIGV